MYTPPLYHWPQKSLWNGEPSRHRTWKSFSTYFHFPFCRHLCEFCGYETRLITDSSKSAFSDALVAELERRTATDGFAESELTSVFFGGGTASLMPISLIERLIDILRVRTGEQTIPEITLECEPGTINLAKLKQARSAGVNRISICAQAFDDRVLKAIGRKHTHAHSMSLLHDALDAGFHNIHLDLIYGLPEQTEKMWARTLESVTELPINHVSAYKLYVFKHGKLSRDGYHRGSEETSSETKHARHMHSLTQEILHAGSFNQYTLTEYARVEAQSHYIRRCFDGSDILPVGPGAFGRCGNELWENPPYVTPYLSGERTPRVRCSHLTPVGAFKRHVILGLWLLEVRIQAAATRHQVTVNPALLACLRQLDRIGVATFSDGVLALSPQQRFTAGDVMKALAELPLSDWGQAEKVKEDFDATIPEHKSEHFFAELSSLLRVTRRDVNLLQDLESHPAKTLVRLGFDIDDPCVITLIQIIKNESAINLGILGEYVRTLWMATKHECATRVSP